MGEVVTAFNTQIQIRQRKARLKKALLDDYVPENDDDAKDIFRFLKDAAVEPAHLAEVFNLPLDTAVHLVNGSGRIPTLSERIRLKKFLVNFLTQKV